MLTSKEQAIRMQTKRETWLQAAVMTEELAGYLDGETAENMRKLAKDFRAKHEELIPKHRPIPTHAQVPR